MSVEPENDALTPEVAERLCGAYEAYWERLCDGGTVDQLKEHDTAADGDREGDFKALTALHAARVAVTADSRAAETCDFVPGERGRATSSLSPRLPCGSRLGDYLIKDLLGRGGMGEVYLAEHELMGRQVALKVLPVERGGSAGALRRFHTEIKALARLGTHPNLAVAFDAGVHEDCIFLVLEYIPGTDLKDLVQRQGPLEPPQAAAYIRQAALGLIHAHEHGIIHRDIKPANLMLTPQGAIKVLDLGLAQARETTGADERQTQAGMLLGTPDYLAPEQAEDPRLADARSDLYSLGCTWYFLLTGRPPFAGHSAMSKLRAHALQAPPPLRQVRPDVPETTAALVDRLLSKRPEERFPSARDLIAALDKEAAASANDVAARAKNAGEQQPTHVPGGDRGPPPTRASNRWLSAIAASVALLLVVAGAFLFMRDRPAQLAQEPPSIPVPDSSPAKELEVSWHIEHYRPIGNSNDLDPLGKIGQAASIRQDDRVVVIARFSAPVYPYILAINPDGSLQMALPDPSQNGQVKPVRELRAPADKYYTLEDSGLQALVLLAARQRLPSFDSWRPSLDPESWKKSMTDVPWSFDGTGVVPIATQRVGISEHGPKVLADLCRQLESRPEGISVRAAAFPVRAK